jgi:hypothetical protein
LEFLGRITLETYVLQFHVFMSHNVQHIPVLIPGAGSDGAWFLKFANMLLCGGMFVPLALWARTVTVTTQLSVTEFVTTFIWIKKPAAAPAIEASSKEEMVALTTKTSELDDEGGAAASTSTEGAPKTEVV